VEYQLTGKGPIVMVLKGGHCSRDTHLTHERLAEAGFTVLTPSRPGYDATPAHLGESASDAAQTLAALLEHLNIDKTHVIGISAAGPTALAFVVMYPQRVGKLVLESAQAVPWTPEVQRGSRLIFGRFQAQTWAMMRLMLRLAPRATVRMMLSQLSDLPINEVMARLSPGDQRFVEDMIRTFDSGNGGFMNDIRHVPPELNRVRVPTLILYSPHDKAVTLEQPQKLLTTIPGAQGFEVLSDSHLIWIGAHAEASWARRLEFLAP
jgi:pimeloyl-ACP methyl ester carboxylesterase